MNGQPSVSRRRRIRWNGRQYDSCFAILAVIFLVLLIVLLVTLLPGNPCKLLKTQPNMEELLKQKKNLAADNNTALANMVGYIHFGPDRGYLPMVLSKFDIKEARAELASECATLKLIYDTRVTAGSPYVDILGFSLDVPTEMVDTDDSGTSGHSCQLNSRLRFYDLGIRFSCTKQITGKCRTGNAANHHEQSLTELVLGSLELELSGNPTIISRGDFSKQVKFGESCSIFGV